MGLFRKRSYITINRTKVDLSEQSELPTVPDGKWVKCPSCDKIVYKEDLGSLKVCPHCDAHFRINAAERLAITVDTFQELFEDEKPKVDVAFPGYEVKLEKASKVAKENEAVTVGVATIGEESFICCVMNSFFMMGSMGQVVGEKITKAFQEGIKRQLPSCDFYRFRWCQNARRNLFSDANGENLRSCGRTPSSWIILFNSIDGSNYRRRHCKLCDARRHYFSRTKSDRWICWKTCCGTNHEPKNSQMISNKQKLFLNKDLLMRLFTVKK